MNQLQEYIQQITGAHSQILDNLATIKTQASVLTALTHRQQKCAQEQQKLHEEVPQLRNEMKEAQSKASPEETGSAHFDTKESLHIEVWLI